MTIPARTSPIDWMKLISTQPSGFRTPRASKLESRGIGDGGDLISQSSTLDAHERLGDGPPALTEASKDELQPLNLIHQPLFLDAFHDIRRQLKGRVEGASARLSHPQLSRAHREGGLPIGLAHDDMGVVFGRIDVKSMRWR